MIETTHINPTEFRYLLALWHTPGIGSIKSQQLLKFFGNAENIFKANTNILNSFQLEPTTVAALTQPDWSMIDNAIEWREKSNTHHLLSIYDSHYPDRLKQIYNPPLFLYVMGDIQSLQSKQIAMVGSRNPTVIGVDIAFDFANQLSQAGLCVVSGLAWGIDAASHRGALAGTGQTVAVLGHGLLHIYPKRHFSLAQEIISKGGVLVSEFSLPTLPIAQHFPQRNRMISGLSLGILVIEATCNSGSLITARFAMEQNREVFAVPGAIRNPLSSGCHQLIQEGAKLVRNIADILEELNISADLPAKKTVVDYPKNLDKDYLKLLRCVGHETTSMDLIVEKTGFSIATVTAMLVHCELEGYVKSVIGGYVLAE